MADGYDKFFKDAQKATGLSKGEPRFKVKDDPAFKSLGEYQQKPQQKAQKSGSQKGGGKSFLSPEDKLRRRLTDRINNKKQRSLRRRAKFPVGPAIFASLTLVVCGVGYMKSDVLDLWFEKVEVGVFGSAHAASPQAGDQKTGAQKVQPKVGAKDAAKPATSEAKTSQDALAKKEKAAESKAEGATTSAPDVKQWSQEELSFFSKLNDRKKELDLREADLNKLEEELQKRQSELDERLKALEAMRAEISKTLKSRVASDQTKVDKLVQFYSSMKPAQAAKVIESLNEDLAIEILDKLKKKNAAEILDMMNAKRARRLSELLTGYQRTVASTNEGERETAKDEGQKSKGKSQ